MPDKKVQKLFSRFVWKYSHILRHMSHAWRTPAVNLAQQQVACHVALQRSGQEKASAREEPWFEFLLAPAVIVGVLN